MTKKYYKTEYNSPIGRLTICSDENALLGLWIEEQKYFGCEGLENATYSNDVNILKDSKIWLDKYFNGEKPNISTLKLAPEGSDFRKLIWKHLCEIPYGETITYGELAKDVAKEMGVAKMSAQAVGGAVGHNPISIIIPCHRVIGKNGTLTGYAAGLATKQKLLELEIFNF